MTIYPYSPTEDQAAWWELSSDIASGMQQLGWNVFNHLPEPLDSTLRKRARYLETWMRFHESQRDTLHPLIESWCFTGEWPNMDTTHQFLLILRCFVVVDQLEQLFVGPGNYGETIIPFPRHVAPPNLRRWWLNDWFESKGYDQLHRWMMAEYWTRPTKLLSPSTRRRVAEEKRAARPPRSND